MANKYKTCKYKSAVQSYSNVNQIIAVTNISTNPVSLQIGNTTTDTGVAIDTNTSSYSVGATGLYRFSAIVGILGVTAGEVSIAITLNGSILPETVKTVSLVVGDTVQVPTETIKALQTCCNLSNYNIGFVVYSDGTATGTVTSSSTNAVKLA